MDYLNTVLGRRLRENIAIDISFLITYELTQGIALSS
jgi:hypothetical protein